MRKVKLDSRVNLLRILAEETKDPEFNSKIIVCKFCTIRMKRGHVYWPVAGNYPTPVLYSSEFQVFFLHESRLPFPKRTAL